MVYQPDLSQQHDDLGSPQATYDADYSEESRQTKRSINGDDANRKFFDNINRQVRRAEDDTPTIQLGDLLSAVEHTLIHSAQNLAIANATNTTSFNSDETSTVIALPITFPTPAPDATLSDEVEVSPANESTKVTDETLTEDTKDDVAIRPVRKADESIIPIESNGHLGLLTPIALSPAAINEQIQSTEVKPQQESTVTTPTNETPIAENIPQNDSQSQNVTIIQTINSTEISPSETDSSVRVQQQHITLFSAGAGVFPQLPSVDLDLLATLTASTPKTIPDCSEDSSSSEESSSPSSKSSNESSSSSEESSEKTAQKCKSTIDNSGSTSTTSESTVKKIDNLQEKIAEVEAEPVILTQGI